MCIRDSYQHALYAGASWQCSQAWTLSLAYYHTFETSIEGRYVTRAGEIPGTRVRLTASSDALVFGLNLRWGRPER